MRRTGPLLDIAAFVIVLIAAVFFFVGCAGPMRFPELPAGKPALDTYDHEKHILVDPVAVGKNASGEELLVSRVQINERVGLQKAPPRPNVFSRLLAVLGIPGVIVLALAVFAPLTLAGWMVKLYTGTRRALGNVRTAFRETVNGIELAKAQMTPADKAVLKNALKDKQGADTKVLVAATLGAS